MVFRSWSNITHTYSNTCRLPCPQNCGTTWTWFRVQDLGYKKRWPKALAKSCGGHIQSIPHVIQAVANLSSYIALIPSDSVFLARTGSGCLLWVSNPGEKFYFISPGLQVAGGLTCFMCHFPFAQVFKPSARSAGLFEFCVVLWLG